MAALTDADRIAIGDEFMARMGRDTSGFGLTVPELRAAFAAIDDYLIANAAAINSTIPQPARSALSTAQKAILLMMVVERRYLKGA